MALSCHGNIGLIGYPFPGVNGLLEANTVARRGKLIALGHSPPKLALLVNPTQLK